MSACNFLTTSTTSMKTEVEGESTESWTPIVRRSSLDDFRRSRQSFQDPFEGLNAAEYPLQTPITTTQITCAKGMSDIRSDWNQARIHLNESLEGADLNRVASIGVQPIKRELFSNETCSMHFSDSFRLPLWNRPVLTTAAPFYTPIKGEAYMECSMARGGFFAPMYDTSFVSPMGHGLEQGRNLAPSRWPTSNDGFYFPSQEDDASLTTQATFFNTPFDEMDTLTGRNLHNIRFTASKLCPSSLQPVSTGLTPLGQKQMLRRVRSEKTNLTTPMKKRINKSRQRSTQTTIKCEHNQNWKTNRKQRTSKRRTLVRSSSQESEIVNNGQSPSGASVGRVETRARSTFADMVRDKVIKTGPQIWSVGHDANTHVFVKPDGSIVYKENEFHSISSFALAVIRERNPGRLACDGWKDVKCEGKRLDSLREMYLHCTPS